MIKTKHVFLFGHRKQHGKNVSAEILEEYLRELDISCQPAYFAKSLKLYSSLKYNLIFDLMDDNDYKCSKPKHLNGLSVRDVLIREGLNARDIWLDTWAYASFKEIFDSGKEIGIISDFRFPNEYDSFYSILDAYVSANPYNNSYIEKPKIHKILVNRKDGIFANDGADDQVPDDESYWDFVIRNDDKTPAWRENIKRQLRDIISKVL